MSRHIDESAELYALGMLDESESAAVLAHSDTCTECAHALRRASQVVASLSEAVPQQEPHASLRDRVLASGIGGAEKHSRWRWFGSGLAAGVCAAAIVLVPALFSAYRNVPRDDVALTTIVQSHFNHVSFTPMQTGAPQAKALYAKHLEWIYIVVHNPPAGMQVRANDGRRTRVLGTLSTSGENGTLFVRTPGPLQEIELLDKGAAVARAVPAL